MPFLALLIVWERDIQWRSQVKPYARLFIGRYLGELF